MSDAGLQLLERCTFPPAGTHVDCAVSGGPDSLALMVLAKKAGCVVTAWHVDHGLRDGSDQEAVVVAKAARRWGAKFESCKAACAPGPNLEARARAARYAVLPKGVLTGHTADDQAETVLLNLIRGSGIDGLAGIAPTNRPILQLRRSETQNLCNILELAPIHDPSNNDLTHRRNRVRQELLPLLCDIGTRDVVPILARTASLLGGIKDLLDTQTNNLDPTDAKALTKLPEPLAQIVVRRWIRSKTHAEHPVDAATVQRVLAVARNEALSSDVGNGWRVSRSSQRLDLTK